jgi:hypothetical protein
MALMATMSFSLFKHHAYDAIVLLFPLCYALRFWRDPGARIVLLVIGYLWYAQRLLDAVRIDPPGLFVFQFVLLMGSLAATFRLRRCEKEIEPGWASVSGQDLDSGMKRIASPFIK